MEKLLIITPHLSTGGLPQYLYKQIESLINDYQIILVEWSDITGGKFTVQRDKISEILRGQHKFITLGEYKKEILSIISHEDPSIIHMAEIPEFFIPDDIATIIYQKDRKYNIVETSHDSSFSSEDKKFYPDKFIFVSNWQVKQYDKTPFTPKVVIEYPIEYKVRPSRNETLAKLGLDPNKKHILHVGLFTPRKNQAEFFEYAKLLPQFEFHCVGNQADNFKSYWEPLMLDKPSNVTWWGERSDVDIFYSCMDLFLFTSLGKEGDLETMPLVIREAISWNMNVLIYNLVVYENYFDKFDNVFYLDFSLDNQYALNANVDKIKALLGESTTNNYIESENMEKVNITFNYEKNKIWIFNQSNEKLENYRVVIKDYLSKHTIYWFDMTLEPNNSYWAIPCPPSLFYERYASNNNFKGYIIDFYKNGEVEFTEEVIVDEYANNYELTLKPSPFNCSFINYVEFFVKNYYKDFSLNDFNIVIDAGANDGLATEWFLNNGANKVYSIEPDPRAIKSLNEKFINDEKVVIIDKALYSKNEQGVKFLTNDDSTTVTAMADIDNDNEHSKPNQDFFYTETMTFSKLVSSYNINTIDLFKIDIEGAEYNLLDSLTSEDKKRVKQFLIELHWLNSDKIKKIFEIFPKDKYDFEFRNHLDDNKLVDVNDLINLEMVTVLISNKSLTLKKKTPEIVIHHLLNDVNSRRELASINSVLEMIKHDDDFNPKNYIQHVNPITETFPSNFEKCFRPEVLTNKFGNGGLSPRHYGCYAAHKKAILSAKNDKNVINVFFESDAIIKDPKNFKTKILEAHEISEKHGYNFFSFGRCLNIEKVNSDHISSNKMIEAHAYLIPSKMINKVQNWLNDLPWDVFDLWVTYVLPKQRFGYSKDEMVYQGFGFSEIDMVHKN